MSQLMQACSPATTDELVDIREVTVDKDLPKRNGSRPFFTRSKTPIAFAAAICGKRRICQHTRGHIGGMPARDFKVIDILALFPKSCYDGMEKNEN